MNDNNHKAIYRPSGKAAEYASWACNLYTGCSNDCEYCYCKKGPLASVWTPEPRLKKCFRNEEHAYTIFIRELDKNIGSLRDDGLFFSFTTDPFLPETRSFTWNCILTALSKRIPVSVLTKRGDFVDAINVERWIDHGNLAFGFTLTGRDDLEPHASPTGERLGAMRRLHDMGFRTFASLEPVIDAAATAGCLSELVRLGCCDLVKVGLESGRRRGRYDDGEIGQLDNVLAHCPIPVYRKHSFTDHVGRPHDNPVNIFDLPTPSKF